MWALQRLAVPQLYLQSIRLQIKNIETMLSTEVDSHWHPLTTTELPFVLRVNVCQFLLMSSYSVAGSLEGRYLLRTRYVYATDRFVAPLLALCCSSLAWGGVAVTSLHQPHEMFVPSRWPASRSPTLSLITITSCHSFLAMGESAP